MTKSLLAAIALVTLNLTLVNAQKQKKKDSLHTVLHVAKEDTNKVNALLLMGNQFERDLPDSAIYYYRQAGDLSKKINYPVGILKYIADMSDELNVQTKYQEALALNLESIALATKLKLPKRIAAAYGNTGVSYYYLADLRSATDYLIKAVTILEQQPLDSRSDKKNLAGLYANIAGIFSEINQDDKAYIYGLKSIAMSRDLNDSGTLTRSLNNTATVLFNKNKLDSALICAQQAQELAALIGNKGSDESASITLAGVYEKLGDYNSMLTNAERGLSLSKLLEDNDGASKALMFKSQYFFNKKDYTNARAFATQGLEIAQKDSLNNHIADEYMILSDIELATGNLAQYHHLRRLGDSMRNIVLSTEILKTTQELEAKYSSEKKQLQIDSLAKEEKIQRLEIRQKRQLNTGLIVALVIIIIGGFWYYRQQQQKKHLMEAKADLQQQKIKQLENEKLLFAAQGIVQGQEEERSRVAKDLHDGLGGILSGVKYSLSNMKENMLITSENAERFERTMNMLDQSITELRRVAHNMMPEALMKVGLDMAIKDMCNSINQNGNLKLSCQSFNLEDNTIPQNKASIIYRIIQELLNNMLKHAEAKTALVQVVRKENALSITVEDDGKGFDQELLKNSTGIGYSNLINRITYLKGKIDLQTSPGNGTSVNVEIPDIIG